MPDKQSLVQTYRFDPSQECKLRRRRSKVMFTHNLDAKLTLSSLDASAGRLELKLGKKVSVKNSVAHFRGRVLCCPMSMSQPTVFRRRWLKWPCGICRQPTP